MNLQFFAVPNTYTGSLKQTNCCIRIFPSSFIVIYARNYFKMYNMKLENLLAYYDSSMDKDEALDAPRRPFTRSQAKKMQTNVVGL